MAKMHSEKENKLITHRKSFKKRIKSRENIFGLWTSLGHPSITEIFTHTNSDFIGIDIEHSTISLEQIQRIIVASHAGNKICLPRIASHNMEMIKRVLDSGADGIVVPMISSGEEVKKIIEWMKYPPLGKRSFGIAGAQNYGFGFDEYVKEWNNSSVLIIQIESIDGINNLEEILEYPEIDGVMVGPYDLSGSMGIPGKIDSPEIKKATKKIIDICKTKKVACGFQIVNVDAKTIQAKFNEGYSFLVLASDIFLLWKWADNLNNIISKLK